MAAKKKAARRTAVERAIEKVGGPVACARICGVSYQAVWGWRDKGRIKELAHAVKLAKAAGMRAEDFVERG